MNIKTTRETIENDFPLIYRKFLNYLRYKVLKDFEPEDYTFYFSIAETIKSYSFADVLAGKAMKDEADTVEKELKRRLGNLTVWVKAKKGRYCFTSDALEEIPQQIKDKYREMIQKDFDEKERIAKMDPEERHKKNMELINELKKSKGFFMMGTCPEAGIVLKSGDEITEEDIIKEIMDSLKENTFEKIDGGVHARLKGISPDLAPIIIEIAEAGSLIGQCEASLYKIEEVFQKRLKKEREKFLRISLVTLIGIGLILAVAALFFIG